MSETAEQATLTILRRARDPSGLATSISDTRGLLSRVQQILNLGLQAVTDESTLATDPLRQVYPLTLVPRAGRVIAVRQDGRDLSRAEWPVLRMIDRAWARASADRHDVWAPFGRTHLIVHPAREVAGSVTVVSVRLIPTILDGTMAMEIPDELLPPVYDIVEALLLLKLRKMAATTDLQSRVTERIKTLRRGGVV
jgi:hypothetical protein